MDVNADMSFYCWFEYKGRIKERFREDIERAVDAKSWTAVRSDILKTILSQYVNQDDEYCNVNGMLEYGTAKYDKETGILYIKYEYNASHDAWQTYDFTSGFLPYITEEILIYNTGNEAYEESQGISYRDCTVDFRENMDYINAKYPERTKGVR